MKYIYLIFFACLLGCCNPTPEKLSSQTPYNSIRPGKLWFDTDGNIINAHGGGILYDKGKYYWYGEHKGENSNSALVGITCYSSPDLYNWTFESIALPVSEDAQSPITKGCIMERPKVIYNKKNDKYLLFFHLELKDRGYEAAQVAIAESNSPVGPFHLVSNTRVNVGVWPLNMSAAARESKASMDDFKDWWTPEWTEAVKEGLFVRRDFTDGQMSRDMTLFVDDDEKAYHVYSSEENLTIQIAELTDDYKGYTGRYIRIDPAGHNEAPALLKKDGKYFMITSGCTGWDPNAARLLVADSILGNWERLPNPCKGQKADLTFNSQSTYIVPIAGQKDQFVFMADRWNPRNPIDGRYIWLPIVFEDGLPVLHWQEEWDTGFFQQLVPDNTSASTVDGYKLVWSDEFNKDGNPDAGVWEFEHGFVRNHEDQWYQPDNAYCTNGVLRIEGKKEKIDNPKYDAKSKDWRTNRPHANYSSALLKTVGKKEFLYGRFEVRAKIPVSKGAWPAIWTLGRDMEWPSCGEIDIMEYYQINDKPHILANTAWGTNQKYNAKWNTKTVPYNRFERKDPLWAQKFHVWRMDWDENAIRLYLDDELLNETLLETTQNGELGGNKNPFRQPHYLLLNLAIGGDNGGTPDDSAFPLYYDIDYVRVYQK